MRRSGADAAAGHEIDGIAGLLQNVQRPDVGITRPAPPVQCQPQAGPREIAAQPGGVSGTTPGDRGRRRPEARSNSGAPWRGCGVSSTTSAAGHSAPGWQPAAPPRPPFPGPDAVHVLEEQGQVFLFRRNDGDDGGVCWQEVEPAEIPATPGSEMESGSGGQKRRGQDADSAGAGGSLPRWRRTPRAALAPTTSATDSPRRLRNGCTLARASRAG